MTKTSTRRRADTQSALWELASLHAVQRSYIDNSGQIQPASEQALRATLGALGADMTSGAGQAVRARQAELRARPLEPTLVAWDGRLASIFVRLPHRTPLLTRGCKWQVSVEIEDGGTRSLLISGDVLAVAHDPVLPGMLMVEVPVSFQLDPGYHQLHLEAGTGRHLLRCQSVVISAPIQCYSPASERRKTWGAFLPLYALRSRRDWGAGDFESLRQLHAWVRSIGGSWTATLPLLSAFLDEPFEPSPYMPVSRLFWNELFIAPELAPECTASTEAQRLMNSPRWRDSRRRVHQNHQVAYREAMRVKRPVLEAMVRQLERAAGPRRDALQRFLHDHPLLADYARFRAAVEKRGKSWGGWPARQRSGELSEEDTTPAAELYHQYVQWIADQQLARISQAEPDAGLYLDFPLGVNPQGYDVWRNQHLFALNAAAGAPPDDLFPDGQNWGFPPLHPERIRQDGYRYLRESLRHQMRHARVLRVDHVMGFNRLYWIAQNVATRDGVYVHYHAEEMYAVVSVESHRAGCMVVGENLGTVPEAVTQALARHGVMGMRVQQFRISLNGRKALAAPSRNEVASLNTHDTPPFAGFLLGQDIDDLERLGVFTTERAARKRVEREAIVASLGYALKVREPRRKRQYSHLLARSLQWLAESPAAGVIVSIEDLWGESEPQNIPGTGPGSAYPGQENWRRKAQCSLEKFTSDGSLARRLRKTFSRRNAARNPRV